MNKVFQLRFEWLEPDDGRPEGGQYVLPDEAMRLLDVAARHSGLSGRTVMRVQERGFNQNNDWPWAIVIFPSEYALAGHITDVRGVRENVQMSSFSHIYNYLEQIPPPDVPMVSMLFVRKKGVFSALAARSPLFAAAWELLKDKSHQTPWMCFSESPDVGWLASNENVGDQIYLDRKQRVVRVNFQHPVRPVTKESGEALRAATEAYAAGDFSQAGIHCSSALTADPRLAEAWYLMGLVHMESGDLDQARHALQQALKSQPDWIEVLGNLAVVHFRQYRPRQGLAALGRIMEINPFEEEALWRLATALYESGAREKSIPYYQRFLDLEPEAGWCWLNLGTACCAVGRQAEALAAFEKAVACDPDDALAWNNLGFTRAGIGQHEPAIRACRRAIKLDPSLCSAWDSLGFVYLIKGDYEKAIPAFLKALELRPEHPDAWRHLLHTYHRGGMEDRFKSAMAYLRSTLPREAAVVEKEMERGSIS